LPLVSSINKWRRGEKHHYQSDKEAKIRGSVWIEYKVLSSLRATFLLAPREVIVAGGFLHCQSLGSLIIKAVLLGPSSLA
jgi:hypothetical protein